MSLNNVMITSVLLYTILYDNSTIGGVYSCEIMTDLVLSCEIYYNKND